MSAGSARAAPPLGGDFQQLALFSAVAVLTGHPRDRLRQTGTPLGQASTQLAPLRLDTDEIPQSINTGILAVDCLGREAFANRAAAQVFGVSTTLISDHLPPDPSLQIIERAYIQWVLRSEGGNRSRTAGVLGIDPSTLYRQLVRYGLQE